MKPCSTVLFAVFVAAFLCCASSVADEVWAPVVVGPRQGGVVLLPDGALKMFYAAGEEGTYRNFSKTSRDGGLTWGEETFEYEGPRAFLPFLDRDGEVHVFPMVARVEDEDKRIVAVNYFIDIWHVRTRNGRTEWTEPKVIFKGYVGSLNGVTQLSTGRIVLPFAEWLGDRKTGAPVGANVITCVYSDDGGATWSKSPSQLSAPVYSDFNGSGYGACEPCIIELKDGRVYMLARTDAGRLYDSYSDDGVVWDLLRPTDFFGTDAPTGLVRLDDGRIVMFWNGCEKPPRHNGDGVYGGRDALHAAISDDECRTWRGYREVYRDPTRNDTPPERGDRGTAYPYPYRAPDGKLMLMTGQGRAGATVVFDPDWLLETRQSETFAKGLDAWSVFKPFGPAKGWWRDRRQGPELVDAPDVPGAKMLHVRRPDSDDGDGAVWNFPMGSAGELTLRLMLREGFGGARISLMDRYFDPTDPAGDVKAVFSLPIAPDGHISLRESLEVGAWHTMTFRWDVVARTCAVAVDGEPKVFLQPTDRDVRGVNYLRVRSTADGTDAAGLYLAGAEVEVSP